MRPIVIAVFAVMLSSCATQSDLRQSSDNLVAQDADPATVATLADTIGFDEDGKNARVFIVEAVDGTQIRNALNACTRFGFGSATGFAPMPTDRKVPLAQRTYTLKATHIGGAPIAQLFGMAKGSFKSISGEVAFKPEAGRAYKVNGVLTEAEAAVWIEEVESGKAVTSRVHGK